MTNEDPIDVILGLFQERGDAAYLGEPVSQTEHALQTAWAAERGRAGSALVAPLVGAACHRHLVGGCPLG